MEWDLQLSHSYSDLKAAMKCHLHQKVSLTSPFLGPPLLPSMAPCATLITVQCTVMSGSLVFLLDCEVLQGRVYLLSIASPSTGYDTE